MDNFYHKSKCQGKFSQKCVTEFPLTVHLLSRNWSLGLLPSEVCKYEYISISDISYIRFGKALEKRLIRDVYGKGFPRV